MKLLEGSDTQLKFHITEKLKCSGTESNVDLTIYDKILLEVRYIDGVREYEGVIDNGEWGEGNSYVIFDILSEATAWRTWKVSCDIWGVKNEQKVRFNENTIQGDILPSITIPEWTASD